ncbi:MAG TPA: ABC transporter substrate-binding protein [Alphaproteobacteria bacterium]|nr:ABC transporter substrate-binding protein [Alphaproteobacteria bacterium]
MLRIFAILVAALIALGTLSAAPKPAAAVDLDKLVCAITFWPFQGINKLADDLGYFKEEGVEVEYIFDDDLQVQLAAMDAGHINCNSRTIGEYQSRPRTADTMGIIVAAEDLSLGGDGVVVDGSIKSVCDLKGKTVAFEPTIPGILLLQKRLKDECNGMTLAETNTVQIATADGVAVFGDPSIMAVASYEPVMSQIVSQSGREGAYKLVDSSAFPGLIFDVWFFHNELIEKNPELIRAYLRAIYRAIDHYLANPEEDTKIMATFFNLTPEEMAEALAGGKYTSYEDAVKYFGTPDAPGEVFGIFDQVMQLNVENGTADAPLDARHHMSNALLVGLFDGHTR